MPKLQITVYLLLLPILSCSNRTGDSNLCEHGGVFGRGAPRTYVYNCPDGYSFVARIEGEKAWLLLPGKTTSLLRLRSASGEKFGDGTVTFWIKGEESILEFDGVARPACRNDRASAVWEHAKLNGVDFRAVGHEPDWYLEITRGGTILFVCDYGRNRYEFPTPDPSIDKSARRANYHARNSEHRLAVVITATCCQDSMSDRGFGSTVTVTLDESSYSGCGQALH